MNSQTLLLRIVLPSLIGFVLLAMLFTSPLAGVPIAYIGLSFGVIYALLVALVMTAMCAAIMNTYVASVFALCLLFPVVIMVRQALLSRRVSTSDESENEDEGEDEDEYEFYPLSRLVMWGLALAAIGSVLIYLILAHKPGGLPEDLATAIWNMEQARNFMQTVYHAPTLEDMRGVAKMMIQFSLGAWPLMILFNLLLGQTLARFFERNLRPSPAYQNLQLPDYMLLPLIATLTSGLLIDGWVGHMLIVLATICAVGYFLLGLAVFHAISHDRLGWMREPLGILFYLSVFLSVWPMLAVSIVGLIDVRLDFRRLKQGKPAPPDET